MAKDPLQLLASVRAIAEMDDQERDLADVLGEVEDALWEAYWETAPVDTDDPPKDVFDEWLAHALTLVDPDAKFTDYDVMGNRETNPDGWYDHLQEVFEEVLPKRSIYTCPECKQPTTITVRGEVFVKVGRDGSEEPGGVEVYPENDATCDLCGHEAEMRRFQ